MKSNIRYTVFGWLWASALLLATACTDTDGLGASANGAAGDNMVTFIVKAEGGAVSTRAGEETAPATAQNNISKGSLVDVLVFAVYEAGEDGTLTLDESFQKNTAAVNNVSAGKGQNVIKIENFKDKGYSFQLAADPAKNYKVAFWAQSSESTAFDTGDLRKVEVKYAEARNNDELRDAFCNVSSFKGSDKTTETVTLYRPLAQINIGTTGWDYEGAAVLHPSPVGYTKSEIKITGGLARFYDVANDKTMSQAELDAYLGQTPGAEGYEKAMKDDATVFAYNRIPALYNLSDEEITAFNSYEPFDNEEYLRVDTDGDKAIHGYVGWAEYYDYRKNRADDFNDGILPPTETFKYLSMVYVLVPEGKPFTAESNVGSLTGTGSVIGSIEFAAKGIEMKDDDASAGSDQPETDGDEDSDGGNDEFGLGTIFRVKNVPVQKNWRTNILGNSYFVDNTVFKIYVVPDYCGDYNNVGGIEAPKEGAGNGSWNVEFEKNGNEWGLDDKGNNGNENKDFPADHDEDDDHYYPKDDTGNAE